MLGEDGDSAGRIEPDGGASGPRTGDDAVVRRRIDDAEPKSDAVLAALTALCDEADHLPSVLELEPLYETLDVGALDDLYTDAPSGEVRVEFQYGEYLITVADDSVVVDSTADDDES